MFSEDSSDNEEEDIRIKQFRESLMQQKVTDKLLDKQTKANDWQVLIFINISR